MTVSTGQRYRWPENLLRRLRFMPSGCIEFSGALTEDGYGRLMKDGRMRYAHVLAYEMLRGPVPEGLELDHLCRVPACVNPAHLEPVTHAENCRRAGLSGVGATSAAKTTCPQGHPYDRVNPQGERYCSFCYNKRKREYLRKRRAEMRGQREVKP